MFLTLQEVTHIAHLARLKLTDEELETYREQLSAILDHVAQLQKLDTEGIPPTSSVLGTVSSAATRSVLRDDISRPGLGAETLMKTAPLAKDDQFKVPPVLE
ncbi:MAG: Asp-tRNA(Asn)/Glu-tRNA(Gln) amidotransferase subunit GatC [Anaerolineales bacterium]|nr:Asp-tRNA(Asn)/Glu-tRNA(Gln) amidotransferase subunit GatC [Anaerolineales bacterium]